jgi:hypothetical protein
VKGCRCGGTEEAESGIMVNPDEDLYKSTNPSADASKASSDNN